MISKSQNINHRDTEGTGAPTRSIRSRYSRLLRLYELGLFVLAAQLILMGFGTACGQDKTDAGVCPDPPPQTAGTHRFRQLGEHIEIPITLADCEPVALELSWTNGRNNGSNFNVTFLDNNNRPIYARQISAFMTGVLQFPLTTFDPQPWLGSGSMISIPTTVVIQAVQPFAAPAAISYTVTRKAGRARKRPALDDSMAMGLRTAPGRLLVKGQSRSPFEAGDPVTFMLEEVALAEPAELELYGRKETVETAFRLTLSGGPSLSRVGLIWIDDAALPVFRRDDASGAHVVGALIYDAAVLRDGVSVSVSNSDGSQMYALAERLKLPASSPAAQSPPEEGNAVVGIHNAVRVIGATRQPLVQIELRTSRPFPARDTALQLQIGKRFFLNELSGDHSGRTLTLTLTPEMFAELKEGAEIVAFFGKPDRSGFAGDDVWYFGRLEKGRRQ